MATSADHGDCLRRAPPDRYWLPKADMSHSPGQEQNATKVRNKRSNCEAGTSDSPNTVRRLPSTPNRATPPVNTEANMSRPITHNSTCPAVGVQPSGCSTLPRHAPSCEHSLPSFSPRNFLRASPPGAGLVGYLDACPQTLEKHRYLISKHPDAYSRFTLQKSRTTPSTRPRHQPTFCATRFPLRPASSLKPPVSRLQSGMNYLAHALRFLDRPYFVAGACLPDLLSVADRAVRLRSRRVEPLVESADPRMPSSTAASSSTSPTTTGSTPRAASPKSPARSRSSFADRSAPTTQPPAASSATSSWKCCSTPS